MVDSEEYFPRGKAPPAVAKADGLGESGKGNKGGKRAKLGNKMENLSTNTEEKPKKKVKKSKNKLTPGEEKTLAGNRRGVEEKKFSVVPLSYDQIVEGMLSIGIVSRIRDHEMYISLPGRTGGTVSITNISTPYLSIMEKYAGEKPPTDDEVCVYTLKDLFQIGQQVVVKVSKVERSETSTKISLTMNPKDLHEFYRAEDVTVNLVMIAAIQSKEDEFGYALDLGVKRTRCFLPMADANKFIKANRNRPLGIGQLMYCKIKKIRLHNFIAHITVTVMSRAVKLQKMNKIPSLKYSTLMPGMLVDANIMETHKTGMMVRCMYLNGLIYQDNMSERWTSPETLEIGSTVPARVLYILPNLTSPYLTLQTDLLPLAQTGDRTDSKKLGAKLEVRVVRIEKRGVIVRFEDDDKGIIPINHIGNEALLTSDDISKKYKKDSTHPCRVLEYSPVERMYLSSFKKEDLNSDIVTVEQETCGKVVSCKILGWNKGGACVQVGSAMQGFIPNTLYKKNTLSDSTKEKLIGTTIKARIMQRDIEQNKIVLTAHKELVTSNGVVLASVGEAEVGMKGHAIIKSFNKGGVYVNAIGGVEGFIPASKLNRIRLADFKEAHHVGQIIEYKVLEKNMEKNHLIMTAIIEDEEDNSEISSKKGRKEKRKLSVNSESDSEKENGESEPTKKKKRKRNKKKKSVRETVNDDCELAPEAKEMDIEMKTESSDSEEGIDSEEIVIKSEKNEDELEPSAIGFWNAEVKVKDELASDSDEEPDQSSSASLVRPSPSMDEVRARYQTRSKGGKTSFGSLNLTNFNAPSTKRDAGSAWEDTRSDDRSMSLNATAFSDLALEDPSLNQIRSQKAVFFFNFDISDRVLHEVMTRLNLRYSGTLTDKVTHIVYETSMENEENRFAPFGWEYMYGLAKGLWQVSYHWITKSLYYSRCLPLTDFEISGCGEPADKTFSLLKYQSFKGTTGIPGLSRVNREKGNPGLFDGFTFHSYKRCGFGKLSKKNIGYLAVCAGAQLTNREPDPETIDPLEFPSRFHTMEDNNHRFTLTTHVILYTDRDVPPESKKYDMEHVKTLKLDWLVASLGHFQLVDPDGFL